MAVPILQTITPDAALRGMRVELHGVNLDGCTVVLSIDDDTIDVTPESTTDNEIVFLVPFEAVLGKNTVLVRNGDGDSTTLHMVVTTDPLLGFELCLPPKTAEDYRIQATQLQPEGRPWSLDAGSRWQKLLGAVCDEIARIRQRACDLRAEQQPTKTVDLLPEWETELGLPEPCNLYAPQEFEQRRNEVIRKSYSVGGNSIGYFRQLAALTGINIKITEDTGTEVFLVDRNTIGDPLNGIIWLFSWYVEVQDYTIRDFLVDRDVVGTPLRSWGADEIECYFNRLKPAHTNLVIRFAPLGDRYGYGYFAYGISPYGL